MNNHIILYKNHGDSIGYWEGFTDGNGKVILQYARKLDGKVTKKEYQAEPKNVGRANETTAEEQAALELESRSKKQLDKGYVRTVEQAYSPSTNSLGLLKPVLATPIEKVKPEKIDWENAFVQPKLDGHRALFKDGVLYSRGGKEINMPHIVEAIQEMGLDHLHLDGELYLHGVSLQDISKLVKKQRPESVYIKYYTYDIVQQSMPFYDRFQTLLESHDWKVGDTLSLLPTDRVGDMEHVMEKHALFTQGGYEGTILRHGDIPYRDGKRCRSLLKIKNFQDEEFEIVGWEEGKPYVTEKGTYRLITWILRTKEGKTFTATAQGNMYEKHQLALTADDHIGKMLTVKFHYYSSDGIPQLPVALRFREDL